MQDRLILEDGTEFFGEIFGNKEYTDGEVVFSTAMTGYEQSITDPSFQGQILVFTYPMIGNYGVPSDTKDEFGISAFFESDAISVRGVIVSEYSESFSHHRGEQSFSSWLKTTGITGIAGIDTRALTEHLRENGSMRGQIVPVNTEPKPFSEIEDPNTKNLVDEVSIKKILRYTPKNAKKTVVVFDFGIKNNILREFLKRNIAVIRVPWDADVQNLNEPFDGIFLSNGPGDPETVAPIVQKNVEYALKKNIPLWGICLGNQILGLSIGGKTKKMRYGHRGVNQPCRNTKTGKCVVTSQNHGYVVDYETLPSGWKVLWENLNDGSCEGIYHESSPVFSVQFHPEACPGPEDTATLFDDFINQL